MRRGWKREVHLTQAVEADSDCDTCAHRVVCTRDTKKLCTNFKSSQRDFPTCYGCLYTHIRWDPDAVHCFHCKHHMLDETNERETVDMPGDKTRTPLESMQAIGAIIEEARKMRNLLVEECLDRHSMGFDVLDDDQISPDRHCKPTVTVAEIREFCAAVDAVHPPPKEDGGS